jgi:hypothetical protein
LYCIPAYIPLGIYDKPIANIILNREKLKPFPLKWGTRQECPFSPLLSNIVLEFLARAKRHEKETKGIQIRKKEIKLSLFLDVVILYLKDFKTPPKTLRWNNTFRKVAVYKINIQNSVAFPHTNNEKSEKEIRKIISFVIASKNQNS